MKLNPWQESFCLHWANGAHAHIVKHADEYTNWAEAISHINDPLFRIIMVALSTSEGCTSKEEARKRLDAINANIESATQAI